MNAGTVWRHSKTGGLYTIVCRAFLESDGGRTEMVVYRNMLSGRAWVRPQFEWHQIVPINDAGDHAPRFVQIPGDE